MTEPREQYEVEFAGSARRDLESMPARVVPAVIAFVYGDLARSPRRVGNPLRRELEGKWSARRGTYRIVYEIKDDRLIILVIRIDHRADVYRPR